MGREGKGSGREDEGDKKTRRGEGTRRPADGGGGGGGRGNSGAREKALMGGGGGGGGPKGLVTSLTPHMSPEQRIRYDEQRAGFPEHTPGETVNKSTVPN